jgi:hypothetical protein
MNGFRYAAIFFSSFLSAYLRAQELFPNTEPASTIPKGVFGLKAYTETYKELSVPRNMFAMRAMYGITSKLSFWVQGTASNHHDTILPKDIVNHIHVGNQTIYYTQNRVYGRKYPYRFNGFSFYARYRFLSIDGQNKHFRMAVYAEGAKVRSAHDEAEPRLSDDNSGYGGGLIVTQLHKKLAVSLTLGYIKPIPYSEVSGHDYIKLFYGDAFTYNLSLGYLIYPKKYKGYDQDNYNVYLEILGKTYKQAELHINDDNILIESPSLKSGHFIETVFGIQRIINSNTRLDFTIKVPALNRSYVHFYPVYMVSWQRYFYFNKKKRTDALKARFNDRIKR